MDRLRITVEGKTYEVVVEKIAGGETTTPSATPVVRTNVTAAAAPAKAAPAAAAKASSGGAGDVPSPLAGLVQAISAEVGATVAEGDLVITLEAMKMFTPINSPKGGKITAIHVKVGDAVEEGQALYTVE